MSNLSVDLNEMNVYLEETVIRQIFCLIDDLANLNQDRINAKQGKCNFLIRVHSRELLGQKVVTTMGSRDLAYLIGQLQSEGYYVTERWELEITLDAGTKISIPHEMLLKIVQGLSIVESEIRV